MNTNSEVYTSNLIEGKSEIHLKHLAHLLVERIQVEPLNSNEAKWVLRYISDTVIPSVIDKVDHKKFRQFVILPPKDILDYRIQQHDLQSKKIHSFVCNNDI